MFLNLVLAQDVVDVPLIAFQEIGNQRAMTLPPEDFRTHHSGPGSLRQICQAFYP